MRIINLFWALHLWSSDIKRLKNLSVYRVLHFAKSRLTKQVGAALTSSKNRGKKSAHIQHCNPNTHVDKTKICIIQVLGRNHSNKNHWTLTISVADEDYLALNQLDWKLYRFCNKIWWIWVKWVVFVTIIELKNLVVWSQSNFKSFVTKIMQIRLQWLHKKDREVIFIKKNENIAKLYR